MPPSVETYLQKVSRYTRSPAGGVAAAAPGRVIVVPPTSSLAAGFERARRYPGGVRLIGHGATFESQWPGWARRSPGLSVTELGAYRVMPSAQANAPLRAALHDWLDDIFRGVTPDAAPTFFAASYLRLFMWAIAERTIVEGLAACHRADEVECTDPSWPGWPVFCDLVGAPRPAPARGAEVPWPAFFGAVAATTLAGTVVRAARDHASSWASFARLAASRRRAHGPGTPASPTLWAAVIPDLERANRHVLESVVRPAVRDGRKVGLLLMGSLAPGVRSEADLKTRVSEVLWGGLGELASEGAVAEVDQLVSPEDAATVLADLADACARSARVVWRVASRPPVLVEGAVRHPLRPHAFELAKLVTVDVARAVLADRAARRAVARRSFEGATVFFAGCTFPAAAAANRVLQAAGARTVEFFHGAGADVPIDSGATLHCVWIEPDVDAFASVGAAAVCAGMPPRTVVRARRRPVTNVLLMTNYCHRDSFSDGGYPLEAFQCEVLRLASLLEAGRPGLQFRWRPHPGDGPPATERARRLFPALTASVGTKLDDDLSWADLVVTSFSTTIFESLLVGLPVFVHVAPEQDGAPAIQTVAPQRRFFYAPDVVDRILACLAALDRDDPDALEPERRSRRVAFGPTDRPVSIAERFLGDARERPQGLGVPG